MSIKQKKKTEENKSTTNTRYIKILLPKQCRGAESTYFAGAVAVCGK
jgi:hypothetical protein